MEYFLLSYQFLQNLFQYDGTARYQFNIKWFYITILDKKLFLMKKYFGEIFDCIIYYNY